MSKKTLIIVIICLVVVAGAVLLTHKDSNHDKSKVSTPTTPYLEKGSEQSNFSVQGTADLNKYLLSQQFIAVKQEIASYVQSKISASVLTATVVAGSTVLNNNGSINFSVQVTSPNVSFNVLLQQPNDEEIVFSVLGTGYQIDLYPYTSDSSTID